MVDQIFLAKWFSSLKKAVINFYDKFKTKKLKYSTICLPFLLLCGVIYIQGLRHGYVRGYLYRFMSSGVMSASMDLWELESFNKGDMQMLEKHLERTLDMHVLDIQMSGKPFSEPWYIGFQSKKAEELQVKSWNDALTRIAVYRKAHQAISPWLLPGERNYEELMNYLPPDSTVEMK